MRWLGTAYEIIMVGDRVAPGGLLLQFNGECGKWVLMEEFNGSVYCLRFIESLTGG